MPYLSVDECIIKPDERYSAKTGYPDRVIVAHHQSYLDILRKWETETHAVQIDNAWPDSKLYRMRFSYKGIPIILDNTRDNAEETVTHCIEHSFWGARQILNISSAGAVHDELQIGDLVIGKRAVRDDAATRELASNEIEAESSKKLTDLLLNTVKEG